jgi:hypothetical protein
MEERPDVPEPPAHRSRGGRLTIFLWVFFLLFVVYPLSIGPAAWVHYKAPSSRPAIEAFYSPITQFCRHSKPIGDVLYWYLTVVWRLPIRF